MTKYVYNLIPTLESVAEAMGVLGKQARYLLKDTVLDKTRKRKLKDSANYEAELIQVAAVAIAALTDHRMQHSEGQCTLIEEKIIRDILTERERQDKKFNRKLPVGLDPLIWTTVLVEEVAEVIAEIED